MEDIPKGNGNPLTLLGILLAGSFLARGFPGPYAWAPTLAGLVLLAILFAFDGDADRTAWQSLAFAGTGGFCIMLGLSAAFHVLGIAYISAYIVDAPASAAHSIESGVYWPPLIWIAGTILVLIIDRTRLGARAPGSVIPSYSVPTPVQATAPQIRVAAGQPEAEPVFSIPSHAPSIEPEPVAPAPSPQTEPVTPGAPPPNAIPIPVGAGKPATVYLNLVGEGLALMRPVGAEHMGKNYYRIVEAVPEGEAWEFQPGMIVRCEKRKLSTGKALVAIEEAPRAK